jgi:hypothetical protein
MNGGAATSDNATQLPSDHGHGRSNFEVSADTARTIDYFASPMTTFSASRCRSRANSSKAEMDDPTLIEPVELATA